MDNSKLKIIVLYFKSKLVDKWPTPPFFSQMLDIITEKQNKMTVLS